MIHEKKRRRIAMIVASSPWAAAAWTIVFTTACEQRERQTAAEVYAAPPTTSAASSSNAAAAQALAGALTLVTDRSLVCMVNDHFMGRPQIPVTVDDKTYYGCCEMCEGRLANDPSSRTAVDPVSQRTVDKATAVIGRDDDGAVMYFENDQNLVAYARPGRPN